MTAVAHPLTASEAHAVCVVLAAVEHIDVTAELDLDKDDQAHTVHIRPGREVTTLEEVTALRAFAGVTDCRIVWHKAVPPC